MLTLKLLGTASIEGPNGRVVARAARGRRVALLTLLALARGRPATRDRVMALLWPDAALERARHQLSDTLYIMRGALGVEVVRSVGEDLLLNAEAITSDVEGFEHLLDGGRPEEAVALFGGPLLDGFHLSDAQEFEHWLDAERARLAHRYATALESLAEVAEAGGDSTAAVGWWRRLASHDPGNGRVALRLMQALEAAGDRAGALRHARVHGALLLEEFEAEPDPEVVALAERLRLAPSVRAAPQPNAVLSAVPSVPRDAPQSSHEGTPRAPRRRARRYAALAAVFVLGLSALVVYGAWPTGSAAPRLPDARSVVVLPFANLSADPANTYFSDGLTEEIISKLSRLPGLRVAARTSSFALRDRDLDARAIGDTLGVATVLEGSVRWQGNRLRVTAQLIDATTGYHSWSDEYDRELEDVFGVQQEIAEAVAGALELRLASDPAQTTPGLEAYDLYLRGLFLRNRLTADALQEAVVLFDRAVQLEPDFALAYAAKASVIAPLIYFGHVSWEPGVRELRDAVDAALQLDPRLGEAHAALGILRLFFEWDWAGAHEALRYALELNASDAHALHMLANYYRATGRPRDAVAARKRAVDLDPLNARTGILLGADLSAARDYDSALEQYRRAIRRDPTNPLALGLGPSLPGGPAEVYERQGRYAEAVQEYLKVATLRGASRDELEAMAGAFAASGMPGFWRAWLDMDLRQSGSAVDPLRVSTTWALVGDTAQTFLWLDRAFRERNPGLIYLATEPAFDDVRWHPRVSRILREMNHPLR